MINFLFVKYVIKFFGIKKEDYTNSLFSPYFEKDLYWLSPTTFIIGEYDGLRNESSKKAKIVKLLDITDYGNKEFVVIEDIDGRWIAIGLKQ